MGYLTYAVSNNSLSGRENRLGQIARDIEAARNDYEVGVSAANIEQAAASYDQLVSRYDDLRGQRTTSVAVGSTLTLAGIGLSYLYLKKWRKKPVRPEWSPANPFVANDRPSITPSLGLSANGGQAGFTITF